MTSVAPPAPEAVVDVRAAAELRRRRVLEASEERLRRITSRIPRNTDDPAKPLATGGSGGATHTDGASLLTRHPPVLCVSSCVHFAVWLAKADRCCFGLPCFALPAGAQLASSSGYQAVGGGHDSNGGGHGVGETRAVAETLLHSQCAQQPVAETPGAGDTAQHGHDAGDAAATARDGAEAAVGGGEAVDFGGGTVARVTSPGGDDLGDDDSDDGTVSADARAEEELPGGGAEAVSKDDRLRLESRPGPWAQHHSHPQGQQSQHIDWSGLGARLAPEVRRLEAVHGILSATRRPRLGASLLLAVLHAQQQPQHIQHGSASSHAQPSPLVVFLAMEVLLLVGGALVLPFGEAPRVGGPGDIGWLSLLSVAGTLVPPARKALTYTRAVLAVFVAFLDDGAVFVLALLLWRAFLAERTQ